MIIITQGLAGDEPTSSERHADDICTTTSRLGADYYDRCQRF
jgi:hypothetical protein